MTPYRTPGERPIGPRWGATRWAKWKLSLLAWVRPRRVLVVALARKRRELAAIAAEEQRVREACSIDPETTVTLTELYRRQIAKRAAATPPHQPGRPVDF